MQLMTVGCSPCLVATSTPSWTCVPSCSCVSTLPMSCSNAPRFASWTSSFSSAAMIPASQVTSFEDRGIDLGARLVHHFLDSTRVDPPVCDQTLEGQPTHLASHGIEARHHDGVRRVVDNDVHTGRRFEGTDIPTFAPDDPTLHFIGGEGDGGHRGLGGGLGREPLDREGEDFLRFLVRAPARLLLQ